MPLHQLSRGAAMHYDPALNKTGHRKDSTRCEQRFATIQTPKKKVVRDCVPAVAKRYTVQATTFAKMHDVKGPHFCLQIWMSGIPRQATALSAVAHANAIRSRA
jgi:hypothetical protein